ncbi:VOC family protein [Virgibacillus sp. YIM 98842]|uniref:VOC family protein n=1 Tax=Virgibacillus sp. YIM 98842 TaxID=2663533 RepID=UPI0013DA7DFE|nr:VOC family protein [Virgibacillus sp. YIM 98842]
MSLLKRIDTVCLTVSNAEEASNWYQEVLGLTESFRGDDYRILSIGNSGVPLTLEEGTVSPSQIQAAYPIFYSDNMAKMYTILKEQNVKVSEIQNDGVNKFLDLYDPDGNRLQVCYWE